MLTHYFKRFITISFSLALIGTAAHAQQKSGGLTAMDMFNIQYVADPQISPDGQKIVYVRRFADIMTDKTYSNLWIINFDGSGNRPLTTGDFVDGVPRWSPDGTRIIYVSNRDGHPQIYVRWMDSGQTAKVTNLQFTPSAIAWSPDGKSIAFISMTPGAAPKVGTTPAAPAGAKWEPPAKVYDTLIYRFNGIGYLPHASPQLFVLPADGGTPRQLTSGDHPLGGPGGFFQPEPEWTPDGKYIILSANRRADYEYEPFDSEVYQFSIDDGSVKALTARHGPDAAPAVSPDGKYIAYTGSDEHYLGYQVTHLYLMNRDGSGSHQLATSLDRDIQGPTWAPDGSGVYFAYDDRGDTKLGFCKLDGSVKTISDHLGSSGSAYGGGAAFTVAKNGNYAITRTTPSDPGNIFVGNSDSSSTRMITNVNEGLFSQRKLGQVEELWYNSSVDQRKIEGWIIKPPDFDPSKKYPSIIEIHGGPFADYGDRFDIEKQIMAAQGYVVLYTNPRGSTSYGAEFGNLIHHNYPNDDFFDLNSGVDAVIA
ncbi:MAG TPA: prolyl oligopeptidase family serine peptidase, partial [Blastocatellia bacterium]|nr:prolyl oligopeptidase family serine peptidase [Blastocatellia bacterium]